METVTFSLKRIVASPQSSYMIFEKVDSAFLLATTTLVVNEFEIGDRI
jgi:hypothetical protein